MTKLSLVLFVIVATTMMGILIVAALTMGFDTARPIMLAAAAGFLGAIPVSWLIARRIFA